MGRRKLFAQSTSSASLNGGVALKYVRFVTFNCFSDNMRHDIWLFLCFFSFTYIFLFSFHVSSDLRHFLNISLFLFPRVSEGFFSLSLSLPSLLPSLFVGVFFLSLGWGQWRQKCRNATICGDRACQVSKTEEYCDLQSSGATLCGDRARQASKTERVLRLERFWCNPLPEIVRVKCQKLSSRCPR